MDRTTSLQNQFIKVQSFTNKTLISTNVAAFKAGWWWLPDQVNVLKTSIGACRLLFMRDWIWCHQQALKKSSTNQLTNIPSTLRKISKKANLNSYWNKKPMLGWRNVLRTFLSIANTKLVNNDSPTSWMKSDCIRLIIVVLSSIWQDSCCYVWMISEEPFINISPTVEN